MTSGGQKVIFLVDMQSFYASVEEASDFKLNGKAVAVCGDPNKRHGITLAANPKAKKMGVKTCMPVWEVKNHCPEVSLVTPHMSKYISASLQITEILYQFTDRVEIFSIDEQFLDLTDVLFFFGKPNRIAGLIQQKIWDEVGIRAKIGIGENKIQAKMACDNFAKKNKDGVFKLNYLNYKFHTGPLPIERLFGVGHKMKYNLERVGIYTIKDLMDRPVEDLKKKWGVVGNVLWLNAQGIDHSPVERNSTELYKGVSNSITLPRDYDRQIDIKVVILEISEEVCRRVRAMGKKGRTIHLTVRGADFKYPTGFSRQKTLFSASDYTMDIYNEAIEIFNEFWDLKPIRSIGISLTQLENSDEVQLEFFSNIIKKKQLSKVVDEIRESYGKTAIFRASSLLPRGLLFDRSSKIGGHEK
ncbi:MAG: DNA polymerase IV [Vulcanibacillus sp.]